MKKRKFLNRCLNKMKKQLGGDVRYFKRYETIIKNKIFYNRMNDVFKEFKNKNVLDIGCHIGFFDMLISPFANRVIGIDIVSDSIKKAQYLRNMMGIQNTEFLVKDIFKIDDIFIKKYDIDALFCHAVFGNLFLQQGWEDGKKNSFLKLSKVCDIAISNGSSLEEFYDKSNITAQKFPSYYKNNLYIIKKR